MPRSVEQLLSDMRKSLKDIEEYRTDTKPIDPNKVKDAIASALENGGPLVGGWLGPVLVGLGKIMRKIRI